MAVHVLALLAYKEGDRVTSAFLAGSINTNPVIVRRLLLALQRAKLVDTCKGAGAGSRPNCAPRRHCMREMLEEIFTSAQRAMERDLEKTTLADVIESVKAHCGCPGKNI